MWPGLDSRVPKMRQAIRAGIHYLAKLESWGSSRLHAEENIRIVQVE